MRPLPDLHEGEYTPRLRARLEVEQELVQDADEHGWAREAERHTAIASRLTGLLSDLGEDQTLNQTTRAEDDAPLDLST